MYTIGSWLNKAENILKESGIKSAHLDALLLLEFVLHKKREHLLAHPEIALNRPSAERLEKILEQRCARFPLQYITNSAHFYGRLFYVDSDVLIPRPESESFINLLLLKQDEFSSLIDVGTGSGVLGITAKLLFPNVEVTCSDIDLAALQVAKKNAQYCKADIIFKKQPLLDDNNYNVVLANLPYVPDSIPLINELSYEPALALRADDNGMYYYHQLWKKIQSNQFKPIFVLTESLLEQHKDMMRLANESGYKIESTEGLVQLFAKA